MGRIRIVFSEKNQQNRSSWDQLAVLYAVRGPGELFEEVKERRLEVTAEPVLYQWREVRPGEAGHVLLKQKASDEIFKQVVEDLMVQAPKK